MYYDFKTLYLFIFILLKHNFICYHKKQDVKVINMLRLYKTRLFMF